MLVLKCMPCAAEGKVCSVSWEVGSTCDLTRTPTVRGSPSLRTAAQAHVLRINAFAIPGVLSGSFQTFLPSIPTPWTAGMFRVVLSLLEQSTESGSHM